MISEWKWNCTILICFLAAFYFPIIFLGRTLTTSGTVPGVTPDGPYGYGKLTPHVVADPGQSAWMDEPFATLAGTELKRGAAPLWNPYNGLGIPLLADILSSVFYPLKALVYAFPNPWGWDIYFLIRILLAGIFTYGFVRSIGVNVAGSLTAGVAFMFCGPLSLWVNSFHLSADILIPLQFWLAELLVQCGGAKFFLLNGLVLALSILGGNPQPTILGCLGAMFYYGMRRIEEVPESSYKAKLNAIGSAVRDWGLIGMSGVALAMFQLLPFIEMFRLGHTIHSGFGLAASPFDDIFGFLYPTIFHEDANLSRLGIGCMVTSLAVGGLFLKGRSFPKNLFVVLIGVLFLLKYFGVWVVQWVAYFPVLDLFLFTKYAPTLIAFSAAVLAGCGAGNLETNRTTGKIVGGTSIGLMLMMVFHFPVKKSLLTSGGYWLLVLSALLVLTLCFFRRLGQTPSRNFFFLSLLVFFEMYIVRDREYARRHDPFTKPPFVNYLEGKTGPERIFALDKILYLNSSAAFRIQNLGVIQTVYEHRFLNFCKIIDPIFLSRPDEPFRLGGQRTNAIVPESAENRILNLAGVDHLLAEFPIRGDRSRYRKVYDREIQIYKNPNALPRAFIVHQVQVVREEDQILAALMDSSVDLRKIAIIEQPLPIEFKNAGIETRDSVEFLSFQPREVVIEAKTAADGILILSDLYYVGWQVYVNGARQNIYRANYLLRGVQIQKGLSKIEFVYRPASFYLGLAISAFSFSLFLALFTYGGKKNTLKSIFLVSAGASFCLAVYWMMQVNFADMEQFLRILLSERMPGVLV